MTTFEKVEYKHRAKDGNGKWKQKTFWATVNPYNTNSNGEPKTRQEIYSELKWEAAEWARKIKHQQLIP